MTEEDGPVVRWRQAFAALGERVAPGPACPEPDRIWAAATAESPPAERHEIFEHMASCASCAVAFRLARELSAESREEGAAGAPVEPLLLPGPRSWMRWGASLAAAAAVAAVAVVAVQLPWSRPGPYRGGESREIRSQIPEQARLPRGQADLRWTAGPPGSVYEVRVLTREGREIAVESGLAEPRWRIPASALTAVPSGAVLYWRVTALPPDGKSLGSKTFSVRLE
jgi:hypothetical protein